MQKTKRATNQSKDFSHSFCFMSYPPSWNPLAINWLFFRQGPPKINQIVLKSAPLDKELPDFLSRCGN